MENPIQKVVYQAHPINFFPIFRLIRKDFGPAYAGMVVLDLDLSLSLLQEHIY